MFKKSQALAKEIKTYPVTPLNRASVEASSARLNALLREIENTPGTTTQPSAPVRLRNITPMLRNFVLTDAIALFTGFLLAWSLALVVNLVFFDRQMPNSAEDIVPIATFFTIGGGVLLWFEHTSHYSVRLPFWIETKKITGTIAFAMLINGFMQFAVKQDISRLWLMSAWLFTGVGMVVLRGVLRKLYRHYGEWRVPALVVGSKQRAQEVRRALASEKSLGYEVVAEIEDLSTVYQNAGRSWRSLCAGYGAEYVILALDGQDFGKNEQALAQLMREEVPYSIAPSLNGAPVYGIVPYYFFNHDVLLLAQNHGLDRGLPCFIKRTFDIVVSLAALAVLGPFLLVIALLVKLDGGKALYGHKRLGLNNKAFSCLKFRSMIVNSDEVLKKYLAENEEARIEWMRDYKLRNDPRVTRIGAFLRRTSIDELPQLINVLKGEMSIVGPRPIVMAETEKYSYDISYYCRVRPGITGLWQVSGRSDVSYADRVHMDAWYVRNWSVWHDIAIIFKTFPAVLKRDGAY